MKNLKIAVVAILVISLLINARLLLKIGDLENRMNSISHYQTQIMDNVNNVSSNVHHQLENFKREQSWMTPIQMDAATGNLAEGEIAFNFNWQIKELLSDAEVVFHYKVGEDKEFHSVTATEIEDGLFEVNITVDVAIEPEWHTSISMQSPDQKMEREAERVIEEKVMREEDQNRLSYYVTVSNDGLLKSGEVNTTNIGYFGTRLYGVIESFVEIANEGYSVSVMAPPLYTESNTILEEVYLKKYTNGSLVEEEKLLIVAEPPDRSSPEHATHFDMKFSDEKFNYTSLVLKAVYSDGSTFEKVIYSN